MLPVRYYAGMTTEQPTGPDARFYTLKEAAAVLHVSPSTISRQCAAGTFPHVRIGRTLRIPIAEVERLEAGEPARGSVLDVPDYSTGTPSMFDAVPEADSPEDDADMDRRGITSCPDDGCESCDAIYGERRL